MIARQSDSQPSVDNVAGRKLNVHGVGAGAGHDGVVGDVDFATGEYDFVQLDEGFIECYRLTKVNLDRFDPALTTGDVAKTVSRITVEDHLGHPRPLEDKLTGVRGNRLVTNIGQRPRPDHNVVRTSRNRGDSESQRVMIVDRHAVGRNTVDREDAGQDVVGIHNGVRKINRDFLRRKGHATSVGRIG